MEETTKAYLAGFIDADGHITINHLIKGQEYPYPYLQVGISQSNKDFLMILQSKVGLGKIYLNRRAGSGNHRKNLYQWQIHGLDAVKLLKLICDYLIIKKKQAEIGIEFGKTISASRAHIDHSKREKRERLRRKMRLLNSSHTEQEEEPSTLRRTMELDKLRLWQGKISHPYLTGESKG